MIKKYKEIIILIVFLLAIFQLYLYTMVPAFKNDDSPETITSAYTLGISHPPGYPLFTMAGKVFSLLPIGSPAFRINLFAIFLAMLVLVLFYYLTKDITFQIFNHENKIINFSGVFILAFSYMYWNQAIEAKGGIYILNLLFLSALIFLSLRLLNTFNIKYLYLITYIFGLSLTDHWPSVVIFLPVLVYFFYKYREKLIGKNFALCMLYLFLGLSAYAYLPIRAENENIFVFTVRPYNLNYLFRMIFLRDYGHASFPSMNVKNYHIKEIFSLFFTNIYLFWIFIVIGFYALRRAKKEISFLYLSIFLINLFIVTFSIHLTEEYEWAAGTFLMPSLYLLASFSINGIYTVSSILNKKIYKNIFSLILIIILLYTGILHFMANNSRDNFISYDFGNNELITMEPNSFYIPLGDPYVMPISYERMVEHRSGDINVITPYHLSVQWGIDDFIKKYGQINLKEYNFPMNMGNIIAKYFHKNNIYFSYYYYDELKNYIGNLKLKAKGLLLKVADENEHISANIFKNYSYRGIFNINNNLDKVLISLYGQQMTKQAKEFYDKKEYSEAIATLKYALLLATDNLTAADICYYLSMIYKLLNDEDNQIIYLRKSFKIKEDYYKSYEILGKIYFNEKLWIPAKAMFVKAMQYDNENTGALQQYLNQIGDADSYSQYKALSDQAAAFAALGRYLKALDLFEFLLEQNYVTVEVYKNMGICNFKINNFEKALKYFQKTLELDKSVGNYINITLTYNKLEQPDKALNTLKEAMQTVGNDPQLVNLYNQIQQAENKTK